jgi:GT2 family glycosyltransferase
VDSVFSDLSSSTEIGIVVPTLGTRPEYLAQCLKSIRGAGSSLIHIVIPDSVLLPAEITPDLYDQVIADPGMGLAAAIHNGLVSFPESVKYVNWLGDDDLLKPESLEMTSRALQQNKEAVFVFGGCDYIDSSNQLIFTNKSGKYAVLLMRCGPQLIPQPGSLFRRDAYLKIGGLNTELKWAFDLDLLIRLSQIGKFKFLNRTLASFRWHEDSLSVGGRDGSVREASHIRKLFLPAVLRPISEIWELPMRTAIMYAGTKVSRRGEPR